MELRKRFRELVEAPEILVLPGAYDSLSAKLIEAAGFSAGMMTGYGHSASKLGQPDVGLLTFSEMAEAARDTINAVSIPFVIDGDTGFGNNVNVVRTVREYERAGAAAARTDRNFLIIARTDARTAYGLDEALRRAKLYEAAGADIIFVESLESAEEMERVNREISLPTLANMVEGGRSPYLTAGELQAAGYSAVYFPVAPLYAAAKGVYGLLRSIRDSGSAKAFSDAGAMLSFEEFNAFIGLDGIRRIESGDFGGLEEKSNGHF